MFTDDLTGDDLTEEEVQTVTFAAHDTKYTIDLSRTNAPSLRNDFAAWIEHARRVTRPRTTSRNSHRTTTGARRPNADQNLSAAIQEWAC